MKLIIVIAALLLPVISFAGELRYVVPTRHQFGTTESHYLWRSFSDFDTCTRATKDAIINGGVKTVEQLESNPNVVMFCETGVVKGFKPKIGSLNTGVQVELLDSKECVKMVFVRVLTGTVKGETGCIAAEALSSIKPK